MVSLKARIFFEQYITSFVMNQLKTKETPDSVIAIFQTAFDDLKKEGKLAEIFRHYGK